ncbi:hypothetical protein ACTFIR_009397 [Dictyostelium discoideum]
MTSTTILSKKAIRKAKESSTAKRAVEVISASDDAIKLEEFVKDSYGIKLVPDTTVPIPKAVESVLISKKIKNHVHKTKAKINFRLLDVKEEFVEQINIQVNNIIYTFFVIELDINDSNQLHCNVKAPRKHVTVSNDIQWQYQRISYKVCLSIHSQICDILAKTNPEEEEIPAVSDFINNSFEDVIIDKLPDIPDQLSTVNK